MRKLGKKWTIFCGTALLTLFCHKASCSIFDSIASGFESVESGIESVGEDVGGGVVKAADTVGSGIQKAGQGMYDVGGYIVKGADIAVNNPIARGAWKGLEAAGDGTYKVGEVTVDSVANTASLVDSGIVAGLGEFNALKKYASEGLDEAEEGIHKAIQDGPGLLHEALKESKKMGIKALLYVFGKPSEPKPDFLDLLAKPAAKIVHPLLCSNPIVAQLMRNGVRDTVTNTMIYGKCKVKLYPEACKRSVAPYASRLVNVYAASLLKTGSPTKGIDIGSLPAGMKRFIKPNMTLKEFFEEAVSHMQFDKNALLYDLKNKYFDKRPFPYYNHVYLATLFLILRKSYIKKHGGGAKAKVSLKQLCTYAKELSGK